MAVGLVSKGHFLQSGTGGSKITVNSALLGEDTVCEIIKCGRCRGIEFSVYDGGGVSGCAGGVFAMKCLGCGNVQMLMDDAA